MEFFFLLWVLMGVGAGALASTKGRSAIGFGLFGFFLGPIGLIAALIASPGVQTENAPGRIACPRCAEPIMPAARACRFCGCELNPASDAIDPGSSTFASAEEQRVANRGGPVPGQGLMDWLLWGKRKT